MAVGRCLGPQYEAVEVLAAISQQVLLAEHEEDFLRTLASIFREYVGADAVILRFLERHLHTRAVATKDGVTTFAPDELWEPFSREDQEMWLELQDGLLCRDIESSPHIKPKFRAHALGLGLRSGYMVPAIRDGEICGQVIFAWRSRVAPAAEQTRELRQMADYACLQFALFNLKKASEMDPMTGLLNWTGLQRRWALTGSRRRGAVLFIDFERMRSLVHARGRLAADDVLRATARMVHEVVQSGAAVGRFGRDAFVVLIPDVSPSDVEAVHRKVMRRFEQFADTLTEPRPRVVVGAALWPRHGKDLTSLVTLAERNTYEAKQRRVRLTMSTDGNPEQGRVPRMFIDGWLTRSADGILITDADLSVIYVNPAYERMTGYSLDEWLGKAPGFIAAGKTPLSVYENMWQQLNTNGAWVGHVVNRRRMGDEWVSYLSITRLLDRSGRVTGYLGIARDVTELSGEEHLQSPSWSVFEDAFTKEALVVALAEAAQLHSGETTDHLRRVREFTHLLVVGAAARGHEEFLSYEFRSAVTLASVLHDVGKLAIPQGLFQKPGKLSRQEYELVKTHTVSGRELLQSHSSWGGSVAPPSLLLKTAADIAGGHHERWDGTGYPDRLSGQDIPIAARVVAIADVYDALRSRRPHREAWTHTEATAYIEAGAGKQFDPELVAVFSELSDAFDQVFQRVTDRYRTGTA